MSGSRYGREKERESPRRGYGSRNEPGRGRGKIEFKGEEKGDEAQSERGRWLRRPRDSSPDASNIELARGRRNKSPEPRRVKARRDNEGERDAESEEDGAGKRGKVRKHRDYSSDEEERSLRRRVEDDRITSRRTDRGGEVGAPQVALREEDLKFSLGLQTGNEGEAGMDTVARGNTQEVRREVHLGGSLSRVVVENKDNPRLQVNVESMLRRIASPSPTTKPHLPSASESESGDSDSSRSASPGSLTPERAPFSKPTRATPDIRRRERSPNPSPLSPRSRFPPPGTLGALSPIMQAKLAEEEEGEVGPGVDDQALIPSIQNGAEEGFRHDRFSGDLKPVVGEEERTLEEGETLDRWIPGDDEERLNYYRGGNGNTSSMDGDRLTQPDRWESRRSDTERRDVERGGRWPSRNDSSRREESGRGRYDDRVRSRGYQAPTDRERFEDSRQRKSDDYERRMLNDGNREGYRRDEEENAKSRSTGREAERKKDVNGDVARSSHEKSGMVTSGEQAETKKVERERPPLPPGRGGGVYIPPFKLAQMLREVDDQSSNEYQRLTWDALRKSINGLVNKVNASNLKNILPELFSENLIRGRGLFARSCMKSQMASPTFTHVFAALVAVVNTKFPELGELLLKRIILQLRRAFKRNDKPVLLAAAKFIAHLVNQQVAHEILALELLMVLLGNPTDDSVEVAVGFVKECGATLQNLSSQGLHGVFERFRAILHEGEIDKRVQFMIEGLFAIRKANFQGYAAVLPELDLVEQEDQITHELSLEEELDDESYLDVFKPDPDFVESEKKYEAIKKDILGDDSDEDGGEGGDKDEEEEDDDEEDEEGEDELEQRMQIQDETETNLVNLRRTIYLTIMSSVDFEEAGHKLLKIKLEPGQEMELCIMLLECCSQERTYLRYYGLLGQRFCMINRVYQENFDQCFVKQYSMIHRLETNKLRNVAKFFAHLLGTDALPWQALAYIRLTEEDTTSSSRIFIKILFQELSEHLGLRKLNERLSDTMMQESFDGIFPKDNPKNTRFAINFFTSIGLGGLTDSLREYLKNMPRLIMQQQPAIPSESEESSSSESDGSDSSTESDSDTESDTVSDSSDGEDRKRRKKRK
ncbi:hypothetical protein R1flu_023496 [Riccia fluitans]|uniref:MI domain-containing protein n=1 Tax=Riccia fluitans TaxID=41844 RepID=A0ABD1XSR1_9MARC